jgi:hypothetical protein
MPVTKSFKGQYNVEEPEELCSPEGLGILISDCSLAQPSKRAAKKRGASQKGKAIPSVSFWKKYAVFFFLGFKHRASPDFLIFP